MTGSGNILAAIRKQEEAAARKRQERLDQKIKRVIWLLQRLDTTDKYTKEVIKEILKFARLEWIDYWEIDEMIEKIGLK